MLPWAALSSKGKLSHDTYNLQSKYTFVMKGQLTKNILEAFDFCLFFTLKMDLMPTLRYAELQGTWNFIFLISATFRAFNFISIFCFKKESRFSPPSPKYLRTTVYLNSLKSDIMEMKTELIMLK